MATAHWHDAEPPSVVSSYVFTLANSAVSGSPLTVTPTIVASGTGSDCSVTMPAALLVPGSITVTATDAFGSATSSPFVGAAPATPTSFTITAP
jgi:hypothetical protein